MGLFSNTKKNDKGEMTFLSHLEEMRWRMVRCSVFIVIFAVLIFVFTKDVIDIIYLSMMKTDFPTYQMFCKVSHLSGAGDALCIDSLNFKLQSTTVMGQFSTNMFMAIVGGIVCAFPVVAYQIWQFVKPALKTKELKASKGFIFYSTILFFFGIAFVYFLVSPLGVQFFGNYSMTDDIENLQNIFTISSYMNLITTSTFFSGLLFELPIIVAILTRIGVVSPAFLRKYRKHSIVVVLILSAIITPPDMISQVIVSIPIIILYEIGILVSKRIEKQKVAAA